MQELEIMCTSDSVLSSTAIIYDAIGLCYQWSFCTCNHPKGIALDSDVTDLSSDIFLSESESALSTSNNQATTNSVAKTAGGHPRHPRYYFHVDDTSSVTFLVREPTQLL
jgi:hypothetical protein